MHYSTDAFSHLDRIFFFYLPSNSSISFIDIFIDVLGLDLGVCGLDTDSDNLRIFVVFNISAVCSYL